VGSDQGSGRSCPGHPVQGHFVVVTDRISNAVSQQGIGTDGGFQLIGKLVVVVIRIAGIARAIGIRDALIEAGVEREASGLT